MIYQTQLDISPFNRDDGVSDSDDEPTVIPPTPPRKGRGKTSTGASRNLLSRFTEGSVDLANELPRWMAPPTPTTTPRTSGGNKSKNFFVVISYLCHTCSICLQIFCKKF